jgi:hypothetical protein
LYPLLSNTSIPFFLNSHLLSWYHEIELDLDSSRFRLAVQRFTRRPLYSLSCNAPRAGFSPPCRAAPRAPAPLLSTAPPVRTGLLSGLRYDRPPSPADSEAAALDVAAAAAAPPSDGQPQQLAVRLVTDTDRAAATDWQAVYEAALTRLAQAEEEAANASKARDAAVARTERERARAAAAATALHPSTPVDSSAGGSASPAGGPADLHSVLLLQEAAALLNLHAHAIVVNNIRSLVHIVLDVDSNHFNRWRN